jgi:hypothetical protein
VSNGTAPTKGQVLAAIDRERQAWETLLAEVGEARMLEPGPMGDWTFRDLIAHLDGWRARGLQRMEAAIAGQPEPPSPWPANLDSDDKINSWIYERNRDRLLGEVIDESRQSFARLAEIVQRLPDEALSDPNYFPWLEGNALGPAIANGDYFGHLHEEHEPSVRQWLDEGAR